MPVRPLRCLLRHRLRERVLELPRDADGDRPSCLDLNRFSSPGIAPCPRRSLPQYEFRHAWQPELAGLVQLSHAESVKLFEELARVGATEPEAAGRKVLHEVCHDIGLAHATNFGAVALAAHRMRFCSRYSTAAPRRAPSEGESTRLACFIRGHTALCRVVFVTCQEKRDASRIDARGPDGPQPHAL